MGERDHFACGRPRHQDRHRQTPTLRPGDGQFRRRRFVDYRRRGVAAWPGFAAAPAARKGLSSTTAGSNVRIAVRPMCSLRSASRSCRTMTHSSRSWSVGPKKTGKMRTDVLLWEVSDLHLELTRGWDLPSAGARPKFDVMVVAGDLIPRMERGVAWLRERVPDRPVIYVPGNHEGYGGDVDRTVEKAKPAPEGSKGLRRQKGAIR